MPRFYFHLFESAGKTVDEEGRDLPDLPAAHEAACAILRDVLGSGIDREANLASFVEIEDAAGKLRMTVAAREAVDVNN